MIEWQKKSLDLILFKVPIEKKADALQYHHEIYKNITRRYGSCKEYDGTEYYECMNKKYKIIHEKIKERYNLEEPRDAQDWIKEGTI